MKPECCDILLYVDGAFELWRCTKAYTRATYTVVTHGYVDERFDHVDPVVILGQAVHHAQHGVQMPQEFFKEAAGKLKALGLV